MNKWIAVFILFFWAGIGCANAQKKTELPLYKDAKQPIEKRVDDLMSRMTLQEKIFQICQYTAGRNNNVNNVAEEAKKVNAEIGSLIYFDQTPELRNSIQRRAMEESRLGIPVLFGYDVIHGFRTVYPISLAQACSWNPALVEQACAVAAREARAGGVEWTFSPMIDVARDGRWGRVAEGYGEDPYTNAVFSVASVKGYQGDDLSDPKNVAACLKHYVGYGASEAGRDYVYTEISRQTLWDTYMLPYEEGVKAGAATLMSSFNDISGTPSTASHYLMTEVLKERWNHDGFVVSDWSGIIQLCSQGVAADNKEAAQKAIMAGVDMDMMNNCYDKRMEELIKEGSVPMSRLDDAVRRVLKLKFRLGLFENPYTKELKDAERFLLPDYLKTAEKLAEETIVLLKNNNETLPLTTAKTIALVGPLAKNKRDLLGSWSAHGNEADVVSIYEGMESEWKGKAELLYARGGDFDGNDASGFGEALEIARKADVIVLCLGEKKQWSGENASRSTLALPTIQEQLVMEMKKAGKPIVLVLSNGRPLELNRLEPLTDAIVELWQPGVAGGKPLAGILSGRINPSGKLSMTFPYSTGQIPIYYNQRKSGRVYQGLYQDIPSTPLYAFGHGLSYTSFEYSEPLASSVEVRRNDKLTIEVKVSNTGTRDGYETVHWYVYDPVSTISRPVKELKAFDKQWLKAGETKTFTFEVNLERDFGFIDGDGKRFLESGDYFVIVKDKKVKVRVI